MRQGLLWLGLFALALVQPAIDHRPVPEEFAIPRYVHYDQGWVCVDRNPRQVGRRDCSPRKVIPRDDAPSSEFGGVER